MSKSMLGGAMSDEYAKSHSTFTKTENEPPVSAARQTQRWRSKLQPIYTILCVLILLVNYFLAQYDKFILSYFQTPFSRSLGLSASQYGILSGYATGIVYALAAIPIAFLADTIPSARVWVLATASLWWSLCVIFQSLSRNFWQVLLARIGMGLGQSVVEPLSVSLISDVSGGWRNVFVGESVFYVGVYIGEAISGQIATAFPNDQDGWRIALRAIGITGVVVAVVLRLVVHDSSRIPGIITDDTIYDRDAYQRSRFARARDQLRTTIEYIARMRSFWLLLLSASIRQLAGNIFGYYMPSYLSNTYPDRPQLLSRYGIIVGVVGTVAVLSGGLITSILWKRTKTTPLWITAVGGMASSLFVLLMLFSRDIANGSQDRGIQILYGSMSVAYLTAELWLGAVNGLIASLLPPKHKTFGLAIWSSIQVLIYSSGPEIVGLALRNTDPGSNAYTMDTQVVLAVMITVCYWLAGFGFLFAVPLLKQDFEKAVLLDKRLSRRRKSWFYAALALLACLVVALFVASIVYAAM